MYCQEQTLPALLLQVKLVDFNPVGGTTSPLLFSWDQLGYGAAESPDRHENAAHEPQNAEARGNGAAMEGPLQARENGSTGNAGSEANGAVDRRGEGAQAGLLESQGVLFRIVEEPNRVQPNMPMYGVPFDMVDTSEGSAVDDLLQRLREAQLQETSES